MDLGAFSISLAVSDLEASRTYSGAAQHLVRYEFSVMWDLHRVVE
jgi:hypothetical protein